MTHEKILLDHNLIIIPKNLGNLYLSFITDEFNIDLENIILSKITIPAKNKNYTLVNLSFLQQDSNTILEELQKISVYAIGIMGNTPQKLKSDLINLNYAKINPVTIDESYILKQKTGITRYSFKINSPFVAFLSLLNEKIFYKDIAPNESYKFKTAIAPSKEFTLDLYGANDNAINKVDSIFAKLNVNNKLISKNKLDYLNNSPENILNLIVSQFFFGEQLGINNPIKQEIKILCKKIKELFNLSKLSETYYISDKIKIKQYDKEKYIVHFFENRKTIKLNQDILDLVRLFDGKRTNKEIYELIKVKYNLSYEKFIIYLMELKLNKLLLTKKTKILFKDIFISNEFQYSLDSITFEITKKCNLSCIHCYNNSSPQISDSKISLEEFKIFIKNIKKLGVFNIIFTGGEPLIIPTLKEYIKVLQKNNMWYSIFTNGTLINNTWISFFKKHTPRRIAISLDTIDDNKHKVIRGISVKGITKNIKKLKNENFNIRINTTIFANINDNPKDYLNLFRFLHSINISEIAIDPFEPEGRGKDKFNLENKNYLNLLKKIDFAYYNIFGKKYFDKKTKKSNTYCGVAINSLFIRSDGKITLCPLLNDDPQILTNINESIINLKQIWNDHKLLTYIRNKDYINSDCKVCKQLEYCYQGCIGKSWQKYKDYEHIDNWACNKIKIIFNN